MQWVLKGRSLRRNKQWLARALKPLRLISWCSANLGSFNNARCNNDNRNIKRWSRDLWLAINFIYCFRKCTNLWSINHYRGKARYPCSNLAHTSRFSEQISLFDVSNSLHFDGGMICERESAPTTPGFKVIFSVEIYKIINRKVRQDEYLPTRPNK